MTMEILGVPLLIFIFIIGWVVFYNSVGEKHIFNGKCVECKSALNTGATRCAKCGAKQPSKS